MFYYEKKKKDMIDSEITDNFYLAITVECNGLEFRFYSIQEMQDFSDYIEKTVPEIAERIKEKIKEKVAKLDMDKIESEIEEIKNKELELGQRPTKELLEIFTNTDDSDTMHIIRHILDKRDIYCFLNSEPRMYGTKEAFSKIFGKFKDTVFENKNIFQKASDQLAFTDFQFIGE